MAIIREYVITEGPAAGATVRIDDACCRDITPEERARRLAEVRRVMTMIEYEIALAREAQTPAPGT